MALLGQGNFSVRKEAQGFKKIYTRSQLQPITPIGDNPIGWSAVPSAFDAPPNYGNLWSSSATVDPNGVVQGTWSTPTLEEPYTSNPLDRFPFVVGTGNQYPYTQYGTDNIREIGLNPFGVSDVIWRGKSEINTGPCGGIDTSPYYYCNLDNSKKYRVSFWFKRNTWSEGSLLFGLRGTVQYSSAWTDIAGGHFSSAISTFPTATADKWYCIVGYIYPSNQIEAIVDPKSGIYDPTNGNMLRAMTNTPRQKEGVYNVGIRLYQSDCQTTDPEIRIWQPRIDLCDGREPSIEQLLKGSPKTPTVTISGESVFKFSSGQTSPENISITLSAELTNGATTYQWQFFNIDNSAWTNFSTNSTNSSYSLAYNSSAFRSTNRVQIRCTTVVAGITYTSNVLTITKVYDGIAGSNQAPLFLYQRSATAPSNPSNTAVWTFATATYSTAPNNGWETSIPASNGTPCWVIQAVASGNGATDTIAPTDWSDPRLLVQDGASPATLVLSDSFIPVSVDKSGWSEDLWNNPKIINAKIYEGTVLATGWTIYWDTTSLGGTFFTNTDASVTDIYEDVSILNVTASKTGFPTLTGKVTFYRMYPPKEGLDGGDAVTMNVNVSTSIIRKEKSGLFNPATILANLKLVSKGRVEIVGVDPRIVYKGRNLARQAYSRYTYLKYGQNAANITVTLSQPDAGVLPSGVSPDRSVRVVTSSASSNTAFVQIKSPVEDLGVTISPEKTYTVSYTVKNIHSTASLIINALIGSSVTLPPGATYTDYGSFLGSLVPMWFSSTISVANRVDSNPTVDLVLYNIKLEESNTYTGFTFAPEELLLKRDNLTYTPDEVYPIPAGTPSIKWDVLDPSGTLLDTETTPVLVDGIDGTNGTSPALLDLTNEATMVSVDYNGNPIGSIETTQANVYEGNQLSSGWTLTKVDSGCVSSIVGGVVTVSAMSADKATVTIKANKTGYSELTAVYSLTKLYPAKDGLPTPVYSLLPEHSSISKSKTGVLTPSTTSCKVKLSVNGQTEIIGADPIVLYKGRNLFLGSRLTSNDIVQYSTGLSFPEIGVAKITNTGGTAGFVQSLNRRPLYLKSGNTYILSAKIRGNRVPNYNYAMRTSGGNFSLYSFLGPTINEEVFQSYTIKFTLSGSDAAYILIGMQGVGWADVKEVKLELANDYFTDFTYAPEDYTITRNDSATDVTWTLIDPKGAAVDTERVPIVADGTDGANGNDGLNNTIVTLYKRSLVSSPDAPPAKPSTGTIVYNFSNLTVSGDLAGWQIDAPVFEAGTKLFKIAASVASYTTTTSIIPLAWVGPVKTEDTEAADLLRTDFTAEIERLDDRIGLEVEGVYTNGLGKVVQTNTSNITLVPGQISLAVSEVKIGGTNLYKVTDLEQGTIYADGGTAVVANLVRSKTFIPVRMSQVTVNTFSSHYVNVIFYNSSYGILGRSYELDGGAWWTAYPKTYTNPTGTAYIKVVVRRIDNTNLTPIQARDEVKIKVEEGNKATSYVESDADLKNDLSSTGIDITAKQIILKGNTQIIGSGGTAADLFVSGKIKGSVIDATTINTSELNTTNLTVSNGAKIGNFNVQSGYLTNQGNGNSQILISNNSDAELVYMGYSSPSFDIPILYSKGSRAFMADGGSSQPNSYGAKIYGGILLHAKGPTYDSNNGIGGLIIRGALTLETTYYTNIRFENISKLTSQSATYSGWLFVDPSNGALYLRQKNGVY